MLHAETAPGEVRQCLDLLQLLLEPLPSIEVLAMLRLVRNVLPTSRRIGGRPLLCQFDSEAIGGDDVGHIATQRLANPRRADMRERHASLGRDKSRSRWGCCSQDTLFCGAWANAASSLYCSMRGCERPAELLVATRSIVRSMRARAGAGVANTLLPGGAASGNRGCSLRSVARAGRPRCGPAAPTLCPPAWASRRRRCRPSMSLSARQTTSSSRFDEPRSGDGFGITAD